MYHTSLPCCILVYHTWQMSVCLAASGPWLSMGVGPAISLLQEFSYLPVLKLGSSTAGPKCTSGLNKVGYIYRQLPNLYFSCLDNISIKTLHKNKMLWLLNVCRFASHDIVTRLPPFDHWFIIASQMSSIMFSSKPRHSSLDWQERCSWWWPLVGGRRHRYPEPHP